MFTSLLIAGIASLLLLAAWHDIATRLIPDGIPLGIAILAIGLRLPAGLPPLLYSLLAALAVFAVLLALAMRGWLGGGDVKLAAALAVALPPSLVWDFVTATTICGGVLALPYIASARLQRAAPGMVGVPRAGQTWGGSSQLGRIARAEARRLRHGGPLPYAVAIAAGGLVTLLGAGG
jgi:prepilin peptidase CpaA